MSKLKETGFTEDEDYFLARLRTVVDITSSEIGNEYFKSLATELAKAFEVEYVIIGEAINLQRVRTLAYYHLDSIASNIEYNLSGTPCELAYQNDIIFYPSNLQHLFPHDNELVKMQAESYLAMTFKNTNGKALGHVCLIGQKPINPTIYDEYLLKIITARVSAEYTRLQAERQLIHNATHDPLTSLPNKSLFWDRLDTAIARSERNKDKFGLLFIDLDNFKKLNDYYGHHYGDQFLISLGIRLKKSCRAADTLCRFGGDEFVLIIEDISHINDLEKKADSLHHIMTDTEYSIDELNLRAEASIGVAIYPDHGQDSTDLLQHADEAMYSAKKAHSAYQIYHC